MTNGTLRREDGPRLAGDRTYCSVGPRRLPGETPPVAKESRRRGGAVLALVFALIAASPAVVGIVRLRGDLASQRHRLADLVGRTDNAEQSLSEVRQAEQDAIDENGSLKRQVTELKGAVSDHLDGARVAEGVMPSLVTVTTPRALGSGFVVRSHTNASYVVTNYHVIADVLTAGGKVFVTGRTSRLEGTIVTARKDDDLALIFVTASLPALEGATADARVGDPVVVAGSPHGFDNTVTSGIVSAMRPVRGMTMIQISAPTSPGSSGGPVVDRFGKVIGVVTLKDGGPDTEGLSFAVPFSRVCPVLGMC